VFSTIEDNHIYNIAVKREFYGYEIAGIKLHAALDVTIRHNRIHDCSLGTWLDWQTQGTRVSRNLYYANNRDLFVEVSHGPFLVDHNIFASNASLESWSQGGAYVHNLVCGTVWLNPVPERPTPYHTPHSTNVAGYAAIQGGDDRHIGNIFVAGDVAQAYSPMARAGSNASYGTAGYNGHPPSMEDYRVLVADPTRGDHERFSDVKQPVYIRDNVYLTEAEPFEAEDGAIVLNDEQVSVRVVDEGGQVHLETQLPVAFDNATAGVISGANLPPVRFVDADFEDPDGAPATLDTDLSASGRSMARPTQPDRSVPSGRDLSASGSGNCERGTDQDDTDLTSTTVDGAVTQRRCATARRTPRTGPAVWAEVGEGMAASTAAAPTRTC
jgi:hypothetical protein